MGIKREATLEEALRRGKRRRSYRSQVLNEIENEMESVRRKLKEDVEDVNMWKSSSGYKDKLLTRETSCLLRSYRERCSWSRNIWFPKATPKYAFISWLAASNRLSTMDRITQWDPGVDATCVLCKREKESRDHLFFRCFFSNQLWEHLARGILMGEYKNDWTGILSMLADGGMERKKRFCLRYALQAAVYALWRERNRIKHDEKPTPIGIVMKMVDKDIRNKLSVMRSQGIKGWENGLQYWFCTRR